VPDRSCAILAALALTCGCGGSELAADVEAPPPEPPRPAETGPRPAEKEKAPKAETLEEAIALALDMLTSYRHEEMLERFIAPDDKKRILERQTMKELAQKFAERKANRLIDCLKYVKGRPPEMSEGGSRAKFDLGGSNIKGPNDITFVRIGDVWYIGN
jgi:hypothetical protein